MGDWSNHNEGKPYHSPTVDAETSLGPSSRGTPRCGTHQRQTERENVVAENALKLSSESVIHVN